MTASVVGAIRERLASACPSSQTRVVTYSDRDAADDLWNQLDTASPAGQFSNYVVVLDDLPEDWRTNHPFRPELWLTPWDWAIGVSARLIREPATIPPLGFRCWVVDLLSPTFEPGRQRFKIASAFVPWIRWYRPSIVSATRYAVDTSQLWSDLAACSSMPTLDVGTASTSGARPLPSIWLNLLAAPGDRHAIGNLVGPLLLAEGVEARSGERLPLRLDWATVHFRTLLRSVGFGVRRSPTKTKRPEPVVNTKHFKSSIDRDFLGQMRRVRWLLADDHAPHGYHDAVSAILFGGSMEPESVAPDGAVTKWTGDSRELSLRSTTSPNELLADIRNTVGSGKEWDKPRLLGESTFDILLLDLRLFPDSTTESASLEERQFLVQLLEFCRSKQLPSDKRLASAIDAADHRRNGGVEDLAALTLLPLLLSHADPSLPIVLFSSSHQHEIAQAFSHRPNIITAFSKPIVTGYATADATSSAVEDLVRALGEAARLHRLRPVWKAIVELGRAMGGKDRTVTERRLAVWRWDHAKRTKVRKPLELTLPSGVIERLELEYVNLLMRRRYADALLAPHNLLEAGSTASDDLVSPDDLPKSTDFMGAVADLQFYRVLTELRNARAHYQCQPIRDDSELEQPACWAWMMFVKGCSARISGRHPIVPGPRASDLNLVASARANSMLPLVKGVGVGQRKEKGFRRCKQVIGKVGALLDNSLLDMPEAGFQQLAEYAKHLAQP